MDFGRLLKKPDASKAPDTAQSLSEVQEQLSSAKAKISFYMTAVKAFIFFIKEFSFELEEIGAKGFKERLDRLYSVFESNGRVKEIQKEFDSEKANILNFIATEKQYINDREIELKDIIELLRNGLTEVVGDNEDFNLSLQRSNLRMEQITYLDDIRKIKEALLSEVTELRRNVHEKQARDIKVMESLSSEVDKLKAKLESAQAVSQLCSLTKAYNRAAFGTKLENMIERNEISPSPFCLLMCDIDNFKQVNDTYGHLVGDRLLITFVQECRKILKSDDVICRYGGEEFVIILQGTGLKQAVKEASSLCGRLRSTKFLFDESKPDELISFTVSIGVSEVKSGDSLESLIGRADRALYEAKRSGKNRAVAQQAS